MIWRYRRVLIFAGFVVLLILGVIASQLPAIGAGLILHPLRRPVMATPPSTCRAVTLQGEGVALQLAADEPRVSAVVAAESFSDLWTVVTERAPFFFTSGIIEQSIRLAEKKATFKSMSRTQRRRPGR